MDSADTYRRIALLGLPSLPGEHDQLLLIRLQPLHIDLQPLLAEISPSVVDHDADTPCFLAADTGGLELCKREATPLADFAVVSDGLRANGRAEGCQRADTEGGCFGFAGVAAAQFASRLVEPGAHAALPVFAEMVSVEDW